MSEKTGISWTDHTFNPWWGCAKVSPACDHCYAERDAKRYASGRVLWGVSAERRTFSDKHWDEPKKWASQAFVECAGCGWRGRHTKLAHVDSEHSCPACGSKDWRRARQRVFCASMADVFDRNAPEGARERLWKLIDDTPRLDWLLLTKRVGNVRSMVPRQWLMCDVGRSEPYRWPRNAWLGITVVNQEEADRDIPKLLAVPARVRFLSIEPMLGPVTLPPMRCDRGSLPGSGGVGGVTCPDCSGHGDRGERGCLRLHWVIAGGESGPHARPAHPDWFRSLRDQCAAAGVPFHLKQHGEWLKGEVDSATGEGRALVYIDDGYGVELGERRYATTRAHGAEFIRVGKAAAGRLLDGVAHNGFPA